MKNALLIILLFFFSCENEKIIQPGKLDTTDTELSEISSCNDSIVVLLKNLYCIYAYNSFDSVIVSFSNDFIESKNIKYYNLNKGDLLYDDFYSILIDTINTMINYKYDNSQIYDLKYKFVNVYNNSKFNKICFLRIEGCAYNQHELYFKVFLINKDSWWKDITDVALPEKEIMNYYGVKNFVNVTDYFQVLIKDDSTFCVFKNDELELLTDYEYDAMLVPTKLPNSKFDKLFPEKLNDTLKLRWNTDSLKFFIK